MSETKPKLGSEGFFQKYKELIITTIICLFLTGIYDSINTQTAEIKKWYQLMISVKEKVDVQTNNLIKLERQLENHTSKSDDHFKEHNSRIRTLEFEVIPYKLRPGRTQSTEDTTYAKDH